MTLEQYIWDMEVKGGLSCFDRARLAAALRAAQLAKPYVESCAQGPDAGIAQVALREIEAAVTTE